jgi:hypothetical protein
MEVPGHPILNKERLHAFVLRLENALPVDEAEVHL